MPRLIEEIRARFSGIYEKEKMVEYLLEIAELLRYEISEEIDKESDVSYHITFHADKIKEIEKELEK